MQVGGEFAEVFEFVGDRYDLLVDPASDIADDLDTDFSVTGDDFADITESHGPSFLLRGCGSVAGGLRGGRSFWPGGLARR